MSICHCYEAGECCCGDYVEMLEECVEALQEAISLIDGLAGQQAMPDDWYVRPLARLRELAEEMD